MELQQQFDAILEAEQEQAIWTFLKGLDAGQRKTLAAHLKKLAAEYLEYKKTDPQNRTGASFYFEQKATVLQKHILAAAVFVCSDRKEVDKWHLGHLLLDKATLENVLDWYCPDWFNDYINSFAGAESMSSLDYALVAWLADKRFVAPVEPLIARLLPMAIYSYDLDVRNAEYNQAALYEYPITLAEHIWYLFQHETSVNWVDKHPVTTPGISRTWTHVFTQLSAAGQLDRMRVLKESLLASNRNFNKTLSGWFVELFTALAPTAEELQQLQPELMMVLSAPHSKPVNTALQHLKQLTDAKQLNIAAFLDHTPLLLSSPTKAVVTNTLGILEKLVKQNKTLSQQVSLAACHALLHSDDDIQTRAAKLIKQYGAADDTALRDTIAPYQETMRINARELLQGFMTPVDVASTPVINDINTNGAPAVEGNASSALDATTAIGTIGSFDELLFLASQVFDDNQPYHADQLIAALITWHPVIKQEEVAKLEPVFQRAYKYLMANRNGSSMLNESMAIFLISYSRWLTELFPAAAEGISKIHEKYVKEDAALKQQHPKSYSTRIHTMEALSAGAPNNLFGAWLRFLGRTLDKIKAGDSLAPLSTPTHAPAWIAPEILTDRLQQYQAQGVTPDEWDMQVALSRMKPGAAATALAYAAERLNGEYLRLLQFLLDKDARPQGPFEHPSWWMMAALAKTPLVTYEELASVPYHKIARHRLNGQFAWQIKTIAEKNPYTQEAYVRKELTILEINRPASLDAQPPLLYEYMAMMPKYFASHHPEIGRMLLWTPNNLEPLLAHVCGSLIYGHFPEEYGRKMVTNAVQTLHSIPGQWGPMGHLFIATSMLCGDKTIAAIAAEIWVNGVTTGTIDNNLLGAAIGKQQAHEFVPLKRFTDLAMGQLFRLSEQHNRALEQVVLAIIYELPEEPVKNLKKLLEIYQELLVANQSQVGNEQVRRLLAVWSGNAGVGKVAKALVKL